MQVLGLRLSGSKFQEPNSKVQIPKQYLPKASKWMILFDFPLILEAGILAPESWNLY